MAYNSLPMLPSLFGRRFGIQQMSSNVSGSGRSGDIPDMLIGPEALRLVVTTGPTTARNIAAYGVQFVPGTGAASSAVYVLDPPIPGVAVHLVFGSSGNAPFYVKTANGETITSSQGTTMSVIKSTGVNSPGILTLMGLTTATWGAPMGLSTSVIAFSTTT